MNTDFFQKTFEKPPPSSALQAARVNLGVRALHGYHF